MKRTIEVKGQGRTCKFNIKAVIESNGLTQGEVEKVRTALGDELMQALRDLPYNAVNLSTMQVK